MIQIHILNAGKILAEELYQELHTITQQETEKAAGRLQLDDIDVVVKVAPWVIPELGLVDTAPTGHLAEITIDHKHPKFIENWRQELPCTLAHELHHVQRWRSVGFGQTLLEALVSEGLAQHFEHLMYGRIPIYAMPMSDMSVLWQQAKSELADSYNYNAWFLGSEEEKLPRWAGYALGYELVKRFFDKSGGDAALHANTPAKVFQEAW